MTNFDNFNKFIIAKSQNLNYTGFDIYYLDTGKMGFLNKYEPLFKYSLLLRFYSADDLRDFINFFNSESIVFWEQEGIFCYIDNTEIEISYQTRDITEVNISIVETKTEAYFRVQNIKKIKDNSSVGHCLSDNNFDTIFTIYNDGVNIILYAFNKKFTFEKKKKYYAITDNIDNIYYIHIDTDLLHEQSSENLWAEKDNFLYSGSVPQLYENGYAKFYYKTVHPFINEVLSYSTQYVYTDLNNVIHEIFIETASDEELEKIKYFKYSGNQLAFYANEIEPIYSYFTFGINYSVSLTTLEIPSISTNIQRYTYNVEMYNYNNNIPLFYQLYWYEPYLFRVLLVFDNGTIEDIKKIKHTYNYINHTFIKTPNFPFPMPYQYTATRIASSGFSVNHTWAYIGLNQYDNTTPLRISFINKTMNNRVIVFVPVFDGEKYLINISYYPTDVGNTEVENIYLEEKFWEKPYVFENEKMILALLHNVQYDNIFYYGFNNDPTFDETTDHYDYTGLNFKTYV